MSETDKKFSHQVWLVESSLWRSKAGEALANVFKMMWDAIKSVKEDTQVTRELLSQPFAPPFRKLARKNFGKRVRGTMRTVNGQLAGRF